MNLQMSGVWKEGRGVAGGGGREQTENKERPAGEGEKDLQGEYFYGCTMGGGSGRESVCEEGTISQQNEEREDTWESEATKNSL